LVKKCYWRTINIRKETLRQDVYTPNPVSYGTIASDFVYFLSHKTDIPSKQKINLEPKETLYGISQEYFTEQILPNTDPMVRGNELMKLLKIDCQFFSITCSQHK
jgi:hypothetical protein